MSSADTARSPSLSTKIVVSIVVLMLILFFVIGQYIDSYLQNNLRAQANDTIIEVVEHHAASLQLFVQRTEAIADRSASLVREWITDDAFQMSDETLDQHYGTVNSAFRTLVDTFPYQDISAVFLPNTQELTPKIRRQIVNTESRFDWYAKGLQDPIFNMYYISAESLIRIYPRDWALQVEPGFDFSEHDFYRLGTPEINPEREIRWTSAYYDSLWKEWMVSVVVPVYDGDTFLGIVGHDILLESLQSLMLDTSRFDSGFSFLFTEESEILVHPNVIKHSDIESVTMSDTWRISTKDIPVLNQVIETTLTSPQPDTTVQTFFQGNEEHFIAAAPVNMGGIYVGLEIPVQEMLPSVAQQEINFSIINLIILLLVSVALIFLLWNTVIKPIRRLNHACTALLNGEWDTRVPVETRDELGTLGSAFNQMASSLQEDIETQKTIETELLESREKYRTLLQNVPVGVYRVTPDVNAKIVTCNKAFLTMFGFETLEEFNEKGVLAIYQNPEDRTPLLETLRKNKTVVNYELALKRTDGTPLLIFINSYIVEDDHGEIQYVDGVAMDATQLYNTKEALRQSQQLYLSLVDHIPMCLIRKDLDGRYTFVNQQFANLVDRPVMDLIGCTDFDVVDAEYARVIQQDDAEVIREGKEKHVTRSSIFPDGREYTFQSYRAPILDEDGTITGLQNLFWDITEQKRMEEDLARSQKIESLGVLAGGIAHDFNNLLTAIIGNLSLARMDSTNPEKTSELLQMAETASFRAQKLTQQLLTFSRGGDPVKETSSIAELIRETALFSLRGGNVGCDVFIPDSLWLVNADRGQLGQVIQNLVLNGAQAMPDGGMIIIQGENLHAQSISHEVDIDRTHERWVRIQITDQGTGIAAEHVDRIFDPYFTTKETGNGLGLSTSFSIIQKHKGLLVLEPPTGHGTTFSIYLPALPEDASIQPVSPEKITLTSSAEPETQTVILMDDDLHIRDVTSKILEMIGYEAICVADGKEMLDVYSKRKESGQTIHCVIMDLTVPGGMGGKQAIQELRMIDPDVPAVVSSGYSSDDVMSNYRMYGFNSMISKPYHVDDLANVLSDVIQNRKKT